MVASAQSVAAGIFQLALLSLVPVLLFWILFNRERVSESVVTLGRRMGVIPPPRQIATGKPLEQIAADIRRISADLAALPMRSPAVRRQGVVMAYDQALGEACVALGIEDTLTRMPLGPTRDTERFRVECELEFAGLIINPPRAA